VPWKECHLVYGAVQVGCVVCGSLHVADRLEGDMDYVEGRAEARGHLERGASHDGDVQWT